MIETIREFFESRRPKDNKPKIIIKEVEPPDVLMLKRTIFTDKTTIGEMYLRNRFICNTLEDTSRRYKVKHKTCIPAGRYEIVINYSNRFKRYMPLLLNVPCFTGVRIHSGNSEADTSGCILLGRYDKRHPDRISDSRKTVREFMEDLELEMRHEKVYIDIIGGHRFEEFKKAG